jgi:hypothetical protein
MGRSIHAFEFRFWLDTQTSQKILQEAILDAFGQPINSTPEFQKERSNGKTYLKGYQGYAQHSPYIQAFAQENAENFAQVLLFAPLTANTHFRRFNDWYPVLIDFLRKRDEVTREQVVNFINGIGGQRFGASVGDIQTKLLKSVIYGDKLDLISYAWNNRHAIYKKAMKMANEGAFGQIMHWFSSLPAIQPVKAGFSVQLLFGQLGCLDTHNIRIYTAVCNEMIKDPNIDSQEQAKWKELKNMLQAGGDWQANKSGPRGEQRLEKVVNAYSNVIDHMKNELGINPRVLWDVWVNHVAQRYEKDPDNQYSRDQNLAYGPDDEELSRVFGRDRKIQRYSDMGAPLLRADLIKPHPSSGAVSRVHLIAAITPDDLLDQIPQNINNKYHLINAALRSDPTARPALQALSDRIRDKFALRSIMLSGAKISKSQEAKKAQNDKLYDQMIETARKALYFIFAKTYNIPSKESSDLVEIYTKTLYKLYKDNMDKILSAVRGAQTRQSKLKGTYIGSDEKIGYGMDTYDPGQVFNPRNPSNKIDRLQKFVEPYVEPMRDLRDKNKSLEEIENRFLPKIKKLNKAIIAVKGIMNKTTSESYKRKLEDRLAYLKKNLSTLEQALADAREEQAGALSAISGQGATQLSKQRDIMRDRLHPSLRANEDV